MREIQGNGLRLADLKPDHLCYRVKTLLEYVAYKNFLSEWGTLLADSPINGRPIAVFKLSRGFKTPSGVIRVVELPAPKAGLDYATGFEHAEFVIPDSFEEFQGRYLQSKFIVGPPKPLNAELALPLQSGQAKFHQLSLERVIEIEKTGTK